MLSSTRPMHTRSRIVLGVFAVVTILVAALTVLTPHVSDSAPTAPTDPHQATTSNEGVASLTLPSIVNDKILSIPLIPHHVQKARRQRRLHLSRFAVGGAAVSNDLEETVDGIVYRRGRPTRYDVRRRFLASKDLDGPPAQQVGALFQGYGTHYADLWCGTPPQRQTVIVDTGSGITAFPCSGCDRDCGVPKYHIDLLFDEKNSSTFHALTCSECMRGRCSKNDDECRVGQSYQEGSSWSAYEGSDICYVGGLHTKPLKIDETAGVDDLDPFHAPDFAFPLKFGCQTKVTGLFKTQLADGIMGMDIAGAAFWKQMYEAKKIENQAFSLCFSRTLAASREGTVSGAMSMGGCDTRLHNENSPMLFSANQGSAIGFFAVDLRAIYLREASGGESAANHPSAKVMRVPVNEKELNRGQVIVDSGTTDTYMARSLRSTVYPIFEELAGQSYKSVSSLNTLEEVMEMPTFLFQFGGQTDVNKLIAAANNDNDGTQTLGLAAKLDPKNPFDVIIAMPPSHYYEFDDETNKYVNRLYVDESSGVVFGANFMMGHDVLFDIDNKRIGWSESTCDYTGLVSKYFNGEFSVPTLPPVPHNAMGDVDDDEVSEEDGGETISEDSNESGDKIDDYLEPGGEFCSTFKCQIGFLLMAVLLVGFVAYRLLKGTPSPEPVHDLVASSELELRTKPGRFSDDDGIGKPGRFSDDDGIRKDVELS